jgi:hypothetical protein
MVRVPPARKLPLGSNRVNEPIRGGSSFPSSVSLPGYGRGAVSYRGPRAAGGAPREAPAAVWRQAAHRALSNDGGGRKAPRHPSGAQPVRAQRQHPQQLTNPLGRFQRVSHASTPACRPRSHSRSLDIGAAAAPPCRRRAGLAQPLRTYILCHGAQRLPAASAPRKTRPHRARSAACSGLNETAGLTRQPCHAATRQPQAPRRGMCA